MRIRLKTRIFYSIVFMAFSQYSATVREIFYITSVKINFVFFVFSQVASALCHAFEGSDSNFLNKLGIPRGCIVCKP